MTEIKIEKSVTVDDNGDFFIWSRGHHDIGKFLNECQKAMVTKRGARAVRAAKSSVEHTYMRCVRAPSDNSLEFRMQYINCKKGRGAFPVTALIERIPMIFEDKWNSENYK